MKAAVACGGTGGHIFPGLAVAQELKERGHSVDLWVSGRDIESLSLKDWDGGKVSVNASGFPSGISLRHIVSAFRILISIMKCRKLMRQTRPDVLLAMGSYASVGPVIAACTLKVPIVLHEANVIPGRAISFLSRFATKVAITFPETRAYIKNIDMVETGFPVRRGINLAGRGSSHSKFTVLVTGGSQGARRLNEISSDAFCKMKNDGHDFHVIHLSGMTDRDTVHEKYAAAGVSAEVTGFLADMGSAYGSSDIAVCRAGAATCCELAACGVPALLIPLPTSMHGHQLANARSFERTGAADVMEERDLAPQTLADYIEHCMSDPGKLASMRQAMRQRARADAAVRIADLAESLSTSL